MNAERQRARLIETLSQRGWRHMLRRTRTIGLAPMLKVMPDVVDVDTRLADWERRLREREVGR